MIWNIHSIASIFVGGPGKEVIAILRSADESKYDPRIQWIAESVEYNNVSYAIRCDIAKSETRVKALSRG